MDAPTSNQDQFVKWNNPFSVVGYHNVCREYGVDPDLAWLTGKWMFSYYGLFEDDGKRGNKMDSF